MRSLLIILFGFIVLDYFGLPYEYDRWIILVLVLALMTNLYILYRRYTKRSQREATLEKIEQEEVSGINSSEQTA